MANTRDLFNVMLREISRDVSALERYLNLPKNALKNIPEYALEDAVVAISKVQEMERTSLFRPGLYYIVLADLRGNTAFNAKYGDKEGDRRTQWFHTAAIQSIGEITPRNYIAFSKTVGDATLLIFSAFQDVVNWSERLSSNLQRLSAEYEELFSATHFRAQVKAFRLQARRLVHLGEVSYNEIDPLSLAVSQTFKIEKHFTKNDLGCTQAVVDAIRPKLSELNLGLKRNVLVKMSGFKNEVMTYYVRPHRVSPSTVKGRRLLSRSNPKSRSSPLRKRRLMKARGE